MSVESPILNINRLLKNENIEPIRFDYTSKLDDSVNETFAELPVDEIISLDASGEIKIHNGVIKIFFDIDFRYRTRCARCDCEVQNSVKLSDCKVIKLKEDEENGYETDSFTAADGLLNLNDFLIEFITLTLPNKELCTEDCKGLCPVCGADLNIGQCGCETKKINPNFKILDGFFKE